MKIIFLGMQGSGKSTQAQILANKLSIPYIEMGQLLRDKSKDNDQIGIAIRKSLESGKLVDNEITIDTLKQKTFEYKLGYVLDGYPRNKQQLGALDLDIDVVYYIKVSDGEARKRLLSRNRQDDTPQLIDKRIEIFHSETEPLLSYFLNKGLLQEVDGERTIEEISEDLEKRVKEYTAG